VPSSQRESTPPDRIGNQQRRVDLFRSAKRRHPRPPAEGVLQNTVGRREPHRRRRLRQRNQPPADSPERHGLAREASAPGQFILREAARDSRAAHRRPAAFCHNTCHDSAYHGMSCAL
jgi:hypothetical protein